MQMNQSKIVERIKSYEETFSALLDGGWVAGKADGNVVSGLINCVQTTWGSWKAWPDGRVPAEVEMYIVINGEMAEIVRW